MFDDTCVMMMNIEDTTNDWHEGIIRNVLELLNDDASAEVAENLILSFKMKEKSQKTLHL